MVFDGLRVTQNYNGYVVFLEEDHYISPDFIEVAHQLIKMKKEKCHDCDFINLGMYNKAKVLTNRVPTECCIAERWFITSCLFLL